MAKAANSAAARARKKVKKNVADGILHVHASFNNTIITITDRQGNALSWATAGGAGFKVHVNRLLSRLRLRQKRLVKWLKSTVSKIWKCASKAQVQVVNHQFAR